MKARHSSRPAGLGAYSARGLAYLFLGASASKVINFGVQIALTYLLSQSDFGVVSLAYTITALLQVIEQAGVGDVLMRRQRFRIWAIPSFWLAFAFGVLSCLLVVAAAPVAAKVYRNQQLVPLLLILAPSSLGNALMVVPRAQLSRDLRFRFLAGLAFVSNLLRMGLTLAFAAIGMGAYSFVAPLTVTSFAMAAFLWWWVRPAWSIRLRFRRWRYLIGDSTRLVSAEFARALLDQSDYIVLGLFRSVSIVGIYTVGFNFSIQVMQLLAGNLTNILFPALTKLNYHPEAQLSGFLRAQRILAVVGISSCLLQSAVAEPLCFLVLDARKWQDSIFVMQVLSIGMATRMLAGSSFALLKSHGRFRTILWNRWSFLILQLVGLVVAVALGGNEGAVAIVVAVISTLIGPVTFYSSLKPYGAGWRTVFDVMFPACVCGILSVGSAWFVAQQLADSGYGHLTQLVVTVVVAISLNALLARLWMRNVWEDFWARVWSLVGTRLSP